MSGNTFGSQNSPFLFKVAMVNMGKTKNVCNTQNSSSTVLAFTLIHWRGYFYHKASIDTDVTSSTSAFSSSDSSLATQSALLYLMDGSFMLP